MGILDFFKARPKNTANVAKERLRIIVAQERAQRGSPDYLPTLRREILEVIKKYVNVDPDAVLAWDVMAHDVVPGCIAGIDDELISTARLDNQLSCWAALRALLDRADLDTGDDGPGPVSVVVLFDHEEIGSTSSSGADSDLLATTLERIVHTGGGDRDAFHRAVAVSRCVSADGAHATHPNYAERHDPDHLIALDGGPAALMTSWP